MTILRISQLVADEKGLVEMGQLLLYILGDMLSQPSAFRLIRFLNTTWSE